MVHGQGQDEYVAVKQLHPFIVYQMQTDSPPLVSVLLRSIDRPELPRALAAIESQTYRPIEIVFVDAAAKGLTLEGRTALPVVLVSPRERLPRSPAMNAAMDAARGQWIIILDEDDSWDSGHVADLVALAQSSNAGVVYSQTKLVDNEDRLIRLLGGPFRRELLIRSNYLSINAVLFSRRFIDLGQRYDLSYEIFEDWDFWMQLLQHGDFAYTGNATASYYPAAGSSQGGGGANLDRELALRQRDKLVRKWGAN
jgi:glycosyltransferase involved in cell wall biosynthesis